MILKLYTLLTRVSISMFIDPSTRRKDEYIKNTMYFKENMPIFSILEFSLIAACTRKCSFCPVSKDFYKNMNLKGTLELSLYKAIISQLKDIDYQGKLLFSGYGEPLIIEKLEDYIMIAKEKLPFCKVELITNGDLLKEKRVMSLYESGLDAILVSLYDGDNQDKEFKAFQKRLNLTNEQFILRRRYIKDGNYGISFSSRGGLIDSSKANQTVLLESPCYYPFYMLKIDIKGDVLICSHDWEKKLIVGNCNQDHIWGIWTSKKMENIRANLIASDRKFSPCDNCDVIGTIMGEELFRVWREIYDKSNYC